MTCSVAKGLMSSYLDGAVTRRQMAQMDEHLRACAECAGRFDSVKRTQALVGSLGRKPAPPELALKLRVALSQELANSRRLRWERLTVRWENAFNAVMVPATAGTLTTLLVFGVLMSVLWPAQVRASNDVPTMLYTPAELKSSPFELTMGTANTDSLVVEAYVGADGRVAWITASSPRRKTRLPFFRQNLIRGDRGDSGLDDRNFMAASYAHRFHSPAGGWTKERFQVSSNCSERQTTG